MDKILGLKKIIIETLDINKAQNIVKKLQVQIHLLK